MKQVKQKNTNMVLYQLCVEYKNYNKVVSITKKVAD